MAALAASRLTLMPINLLLAGMQKQLTPLASDWMHGMGARRTLRRLMLFSLVLALFTLLYGAVIWLLRDWIFLDLMRKDFPQRDLLLVLWIGLFVLMVIREPIMMVPLLRQRFRALKMCIRDRRTLVGKVVSNKMDKTVVVLVERRVKHPIFGKIIMRSAKYKAHDESNQYNEGDTVEIAEGRPISRSKSWRVVRLVEAARII